MGYITIARNKQLTITDGCAGVPMMDEGKCACIGVHSEARQTKTVSVKALQDALSFTMKFDLGPCFLLSSLPGIKISFCSSSTPSEPLLLLTYLILSAYECACMFLCMGSF